MPLSISLNNDESCSRWNITGAEVRLKETPNEYGEPDKNGSKSKYAYKSSTNLMNHL